LGKLTQGELAQKFMDPREFKAGERLKRAHVADIVEYSTSIRGIQPSQLMLQESVLYQKYEGKLSCFNYLVE